MAVIHSFKGKSYIEPAVVATIEAGVQNNQPDQYGKILLVDAGEGASFGFGKGTIGIGGTHAIANGRISFPTGHNFAVANRSLTVNEMVADTPNTIEVTFNTNCVSAVAIATFFNNNSGSTATQMTVNSDSQLLLTSSAVDCNFELLENCSYFGFTEGEYNPTAAQVIGNVNFKYGHDFSKTPITFTVKETILGEETQKGEKIDGAFSSGSNFVSWFNKEYSLVSVVMSINDNYNLVLTQTGINATTFFELSGTDVPVLGFDELIYFSSKATTTGTSKFTSGHDFTDGTSTVVISETINGKSSDVSFTYTGNYPTANAIAAFFNKNCNMDSLYMIVVDNKLVIKQTSISVDDTYFNISGALNLGINDGKYIPTVIKTNRNLNEFLYIFQNQISLENALKGGQIWSLADYLYHPDNNYLTAGANTIYLAQTRETSPAYLKIKYDTSRYLTLKTNDEGAWCNWDVENQKGYGFKIISGEEIDTFRFVFYKYDYKGVDENRYLYTLNNIGQVELVQSTDFVQVSAFVAWAESNETFLSYFSIDLDQSDTTGIITSNDQSNYLTIKGFAGAYESYTDDALNVLLSNITELDFSFMFSTNYGKKGASNKNLMMLSYILNNKTSKNVTLHIGGYDTSDLRGNKNSYSGTTSAGIAYLLNSAYATVYHSGDYRLLKTKKYKRNALYTAACCVGRRAGLRPQDSLSYKSIRSIQLQDLITVISDRESLIQLGVCIFKSVNNIGNVIDLDVNTLRGDANLVDQTNDENGELISYHNDLMQIKNELQRLFINEFTQTFIGTKVSEYPSSILQQNVIAFFKELVLSGLILDFKAETIIVLKKGTASYVSGDYLANSDNTHLFASFIQNV